MNNKSHMALKMFEKIQYAENTACHVLLGEVSDTTKTCLLCVDTPDVVVTCSPSRSEGNSPGVLLVSCAAGQSGRCHL